ncbi:hypothetical protein FRB91_005813 [Serendipita sp. 411]|nr:hypothetical protein FRB91_005813 [Serendipita sp. 411]
MSSASRSVTRNDATMISSSSSPSFSSSYVPPYTPEAPSTVVHPSAANDDNTMNQDTANGEQEEGDNARVGPSKRVTELLALLSKTEVDPAQSPLPSVSSSLDVLSSNGRGDSRKGHDLSFAEALAEVTRLVKNPTVLDHLKQIKAEQHRLERKFWETRQQILQNQDRQVRELKTKVAFTGSLGPREIERLTLQFQKELSELERDEFLPAYDRLLSRQQATLQRMGIPWMFETDDETERNRQQQLMTVIEGLLE